MNWQNALAITHVIGVALGVGGATLNEIFYLKFKTMLGSQVSPSGNTLFALIRRTFYAGLALLIVSGLGFVVLYWFNGVQEFFSNPRLLAKLTIVAILLVGLVVSRAKQQTFLASAVSLASWYGALAIGTWRTLDASYGTIMGWYGIAVIAFIVVLLLIRRWLGVKS